MIVYILFLFMSIWMMRDGWTFEGGMTMLLSGIGMLYETWEHVLI